MTEQKRYEFTGETKTDIYGRTLRQIRALVAISTLHITVNVGDLGGWIESEANLPHDGTAWVFPRATVAGKYTILLGGTFRGGTFEGGTFWGGTFEGGTFRGGTFEGGTFWGGTFEGGTFWGGTFRGGTFRGGTFWGGTFEGGTFWGGTFRGGTFRGGTFWGGTFWGGTFRGGTFRGGTEVKSREPLFVGGISAWTVTMTDEHMTVGCQTHTIKEWLAFKECDIKAMSGTAAVTFWKQHKAMLKTLAKATGRL